MIQASRVTCPSRSGSPPYHTLRLDGSPSGIFTPASTASTDRPFSDKTFHAAPLASLPKSQVETTTGWSFTDSTGKSSSESNKPEPARLFFKNFLRVGIVG